jgi:hypothetical protein
MNPETDAKEFTRLLETVGEFYDVTVSESRHVLYFKLLADFDLEIVRYAFEKYLKSDASKYGFPKPAHIRELIEGSQTEQEAHAWNTVNRAIRKIGPYESIIVQDLAVADAICRVFGSWIECCNANREATAYLWDQRRKDFVTAYRIARKIERADRSPVLLSGIHEVQNRQSGFFPKRSYYGAILLDGSVQTRYLAINERTGLPAARLADALSLPEPTSALLLTPGTLDQETDSDELVGQELFDRLHLEFQKVIAAKGLDGPNFSRQSKGTLRTPETATHGDADRTTDHGGEAPGAGEGIPVRDVDRPGVGGGSGVAGVPDPVRARGKRVRERDPRRAGHVDNPPPKSQRGVDEVPRGDRAGNDRPRRRKA